MATKTAEKNKRCDEGAREHTHTASGWVRDEETGLTVVDDGSICSRDEEPEETYIPEHWKGRHTGLCIFSHNRAWVKENPDGCPTCGRPTRHQKG